KADLPTYMTAEPEALPPLPAAPAASAASPPVPGSGSLADLERREVLAALERHGWVQARAARALGLTERQIGYRMRKFGILSPYRSGA
ncbi:MAG: helix-turn-helix domain-containing protein, partial [Thermodesulfobacteriota bacterium]